MVIESSNLVLNFKTKLLPIAAFCDSNRDVAENWRKTHAMCWNCVGLSAKGLCCNVGSVASYSLTIQATQVQNPQEPNIAFKIY